LKKKNLEKEIKKETKYVLQDMDDEIEKNKKHRALLKGAEIHRDMFNHLSHALLRIRNL